MWFRGKTAYVWGLRYRWDPSLSRNLIPRFPHFVPPWRAEEYNWGLVWATLLHLSSVGKTKREPQQPKASVTAVAAPCNYRFHTLPTRQILQWVVHSTGGPVWILNCAECKYCTTEQRGGERPGQGCIIITVAKTPLLPPWCLGCRSGPAWWQLGIQSPDSWYSASSMIPRFILKLLPWSLSHRERERAFWFLEDISMIKTNKKHCNILGWGRSRMW